MRYVIVSVHLGDGVGAVPASLFKGNVCNSSNRIKRHVRGNRKSFLKLPLQNPIQAKCEFHAQERCAESDAFPDSKLSPRRLPTSRGQQAAIHVQVNKITAPPTHFTSTSKDAPTRTGANHTYNDAAVSANLPTSAPPCPKLRRSNKQKPHTRTALNSP
jgi:hypothetical protein